MIRVSLIGTGNVASHLAKAFLDARDVELVAVYGRSLEKLDALELRTSTRKITQLDEIPECDVVVISISDDKIAEVSAAIPRGNYIITHTAGSIPCEVLDDHDVYGSFYPLQTFSKSLEMRYDNIPICLTANTQSGLKQLEQLARAISKDVRLLTDEQRAQVHLSAVLVNNLLNHIIYLAEDRLDQNDIKADILHPLIKQTIIKLEDMSAYDAQTGPARRDDMSVVTRHLEKLQGTPDLQEIYKLLSASITKTYNT